MIMTDRTSEDYLSFGRVYKNFRQAKDFTLEEAAGKITTIAQVSKFENGKLMPKTNVFFNMIQNINVNMDEFQYERNEILHSNDVLLYSTEVASASMTTNVAKLKDILEKIKYAIESDGAIKKYKLDRIRVEAVLSTIDSSFKVSDTDIEYLGNYLFALEEWGQYDILLLSHTTSLFDSGTLFQLVNRMINPTKPLAKLTYIERAIISTLLNVIDSWIKGGQFSYAEQFISYLEKSNILDYYTGEKLMLVYNKARLAYVKSKDKSALDTMKRCQETFVFCNCFSMADMIRQEISELETNVEPVNSTQSKSK